MKNLKPIGVPHSIFLENIFSKTYDATKLEEDTERVRAEKPQDWTPEELAYLKKRLAQFK